MEDIRYNGNPEFKIHNVGLVSVLRNQGYTFEYKSGKERYSFIYIEKGNMEYYFSKTKEKIRISKGDFLFIPKDIPYKTTYLDDDTVIKIIVFDISAKKLPEYFKNAVTTSSHDIYSIFRSITNENMYSVMFLTAKIYEIAFFLQKDNTTIPKKYRKILPAINEIKAKYFENHKLSYYADMCNMSESNFRKLFKEYSGKSPIEYRNIIRISEVMKMVDSGEFSMSEAAYIAGFNNMSFFYEIYNRFSKT